MYCHGELARSRPHPSRLTHFYLAVSAGGVVGGALVAFAAPALLHGYFEVEIGFVLLAAAVLWRSWRLGMAWTGAALLVLAAASAPASCACNRRWRTSSTSTAISTAWCACANTAPCHPRCASAS
jgi:hypothetical protein